MKKNFVFAMIIFAAAVFFSALPTSAVTTDVTNNAQLLEALQNTTTTNVNVTVSTISLSSNVVLGGDKIITIPQSSDVYISGVISGNFSLTTAGYGTLVLLGNNTYTGDTIIRDGRLQIGNASRTGNVAGNIVLQDYNSTVSFHHRWVDLEYDFKGDITGLGYVTVGSYYSKFTFSGAVTIRGTVFVWSPTEFAGNITSNIQIETLEHSITVTFNPSADMVYGGAITCDGTGGSGSIRKIGAHTLKLTGASTFRGEVRVSGGALHIGNGGTIGSVSASSVIVESGANFYFDRSDNIIFNAYLGGNGKIIKRSAGRLTLTNDSNMQYGGTIVEEGSLFISNDRQLGNWQSPLILDGGTLEANSNINLERAVILEKNGGTINVESGATVTCVYRSAVPSIIVSGEGALTKTGTGTLIFEATNTYTGGTNISAGTLRLSGSNSGISDTGGINIANGANFAIGSEGDYSYGGNISGGGSFTKSGAGKLFLTGILTYMGGTTVSNGTLSVGDGGEANFIRDIINNATLEFNHSNNFVYSGIISGSGSVRKLGTGTLALSANNTYEGRTTIDAGVLQVGIGATAGSVSGDIVNNASLVFNRSDTLLLEGTISGSGSVTKNGIGVLIIAANNTYTGGTTVGAGTLQIGWGTTVGNITGNILNNAMLVFNRSNEIIFDGKISGTGHVEKLGAGTLTFNGENNYTGNTYVYNGKIILNKNFTIAPSRTLHVQSGTEFDNNAIITIDGTLIIHGILENKNGLIIVGAGQTGLRGLTLDANGGTGTFTVAESGSFFDLKKLERFGKIPTNGKRELLGFSPDKNALGDSLYSLDEDIAMEFETVYAIWQTGVFPPESVVANGAEFSVEFEKSEFSNNLFPRFFTEGTTQKSGAYTLTLSSETLGYESVVTLAFVPGGVDYDEWFYTFSHEIFSSHEEEEIQNFLREKIYERFGIEIEDIAMASAIILAAG
ncbi:MAG: autotransporter-associated beta strand repeat-containing protein, partial [Defluviitaleaceae bacterium]|nr:autotransporter-associated beta strand repeat-containing protein [Defluviitaleaceae bacterium]